MPVHYNICIIRIYVIRLTAANRSRAHTHTTLHNPNPCAEGRLPPFQNQYPIVRGFHCRARMEISHARIFLQGPHRRIGKRERGKQKISGR